MRVRRSASGEGISPFSLSFASTKASMDVQIQGSFKAGMAGRDNGFSDHHTAELVLPAGVSSAAPWEIHTRISRTSSPVSGPPVIGMRGGLPLIIFTIKLSSGLPETKAGPCLPPLLSCE